MFNYEKFENNLVQHMENIFNKWIKENDDIYIFSLDCARGMESIGAIANTTCYLTEQTEPTSEEYWYYKYCEEEWQLWNTFDAISADMYSCLEENKGIFSDPETYEYSTVFDKHCEKIIGCCVNALIHFRQSLSQKHSDIILTFNIREYLDEKDRIEIFEKLNSKSAFKEYSEHIKEFA